MNWIDLYTHLKQEVPWFFNSVRLAASQAHNEAEFESRINNAIERLAQKLGVQLLFREQYTLATGRADAVYNRLVIEYEPPGSLRPNLKHSHTQHAVRQVMNYIEELSKGMTATACWGSSSTATTSSLSATMRGTGS